MGQCSDVLTLRWEQANLYSEGFDLILLSNKKATSVRISLLNYIEIENYLIK